MEIFARITKNDILSESELVSEMSLYLPSIGDNVAIQDGIPQNQVAVLIKITDEEVASDTLKGLNEAGFGVEIVTDTAQ